VIKYLKNTDWDVRLLISRIVTADEAAAAMQNWSENPGKILKILVQF
jgi:threonine dehydrogenase-like Zn-dependent dehydrogenase